MEATLVPGLAHDDRTSTTRGGARPRGPRRPTPERSSLFDHLALEELRAYRRDLAREEERVSYWRRLLQARIDIARAGTELTLDRTTLGQLLASERVNAVRTSLLRVVPEVDLPPIPELASLWQRTATTPMPPGVLDELVRAERQLSDYRATLHDHLDRATNELVARYRERPTLALRALPLDASHGNRRAAW